MKVLITGAAGFVGSHLCDYLIEQGHEVVGIDNLLTGNYSNLPTGNKSFHFHQVDIRDNFETKSIFAFNKPNIVIHLAAIARTPWTIDDPILANETNIGGTVNVLEASRFCEVKKVVFASSNIVYAAPTPYRVTKLAGEMYMDVYDKLYDLPTLSLRFSNVYGSLRQSMEGPSPNVLASLRKCMLERGRIEITGDGEQTRQFIHIDDLVQGIYKAATSNVRGTEIDMCHPESVSMNQIAKWFKCPVKYIEDRKGDIKHIVQNPEKAERLLGFKAVKRLKDNISIYTQK